jgi:glucan 1,3-beta-glucosidase
MGLFLWDNRNMTKALCGINLGGGLVAERWMAGEPFAGVRGEGERAIGLELGQYTARERLTHHRQTYITEKDFIWIARKGFDFVRLPVGYWMFEDDEGYAGDIRFVDDAFLWAERQGLKVLLDFHGLQGSQNGHDHSGEVGKLRFFRWWNRRKALRTLAMMSKRYGHHSSLLAIEIINEPKIGFFTWRLMNYYRHAITIVRRYAAPEVKIVVSDAFRPLEIARKLAQQGLGGEVALDMHLYQVFSAADKQQTFEEHVRRVDSEWKQLISQVKQYVPEIIVGEWSAALPPESYGEHGETMPQTMKYYLVQRRLFDESTWAHCYWSYKAPGWGAWDYRETIAKYDD